MSQTPVSPFEARAALATLPPRCHGAALPHPMYDPYPSMSLALHNLWGSIRPYVNLSAEEGPSLLRLGGIASYTPGQCFLMSSDSLVSVLFNLAIARYLTLFFRLLMALKSIRMVKNARWAIESASGFFLCRPSAKLAAIVVFFVISKTSCLTQASRTSARYVYQVFLSV